MDLWLKELPEGKLQEVIEVNTNNENESKVQKNGRTNISSTPV